MEEVGYRGLLRLLAVSEAGSFSEAARRLGLSRQAVHRSVDLLEEESGAPLLEREGRRVRLTDLGKRVVRHARVVRETGEEVSALFAAATEEPSGTLRITAPSLFAEEVLVWAIPEFLRRFPAVTVEAQLDTARTDRMREDFDLMIRIGAPPPPDSYAILLGKGELLLCASPAYLSSQARLEHPRQLLEHPLLAYGAASSSSWSLARGEEVVNLEVAPRLSTNSARVMVEACTAGAGVLLIPRLAVVQLLATRRVVEVLPDWHPPAADVWAVYGHRTRDDPTLAAFLDAVQSIDWT